MKSTTCKIIGTIIMLLTISIFLSISVLASSPNYATNIHNRQELYFDGYIQIQSSYNQDGYHAYQGYFVYRNGVAGEQWAYTSSGQSPNDSTIRSANMRYWDTPDPEAPAVTFNYYFTWIPHGAAWPLSLNESQVH